MPVSQNGVAASADFDEGGVKFETNKTGTATITLTRPKEHNTINAALIRNLKKCCKILRNNIDNSSSALKTKSTVIRVVILRAEGRIFSAGADPKEFLGQRDDTSSDTQTAFANLLKDLSTLPQALIGII